MLLNAFIEHLTVRYELIVIAIERETSNVAANIANIKNCPTGGATNWR